MSGGRVNTNWTPKHPFFTRFWGKKTRKCIFFAFFFKNIWSCQKKAVLLHPLSEMMEFLPLERTKASDLLESSFKRKFCGNSSVGRARPCQGRGREFESRFPLLFFCRSTKKGPRNNRIFIKKIPIFWGERRHKSP